MNEFDHVIVNDDLEQRLRGAQATGRARLFSG